MNRLRTRIHSSAVAQARFRRLVLVGSAAGSIICYGLAFSSARDTMRPASLATPAAAYVSVSFGTALFFAFRDLLVGYRARRGWQWVIGGLLGSGMGVWVSMSWEGWHLAAPMAVAVGTGAVLFGGAFGVVWARTMERRGLTDTSRTPADRRSAAGMYAAASKYAMNRRGASAEEGRTTRLNRAIAAIAGSHSDQAPDRLAEATDELRQLLDDASADWMKLLITATSLADAISAKADKQGDLTGYPQVLQIVTDVADRMPADLGATAVVFRLRADYHFAMANSLPLGPAADEHWADAVADLQAAIQAIRPPLRHLLPGLHAKLGFALALTAPEAEGLPIGIAQCRRAIELAGPSFRARAAPQLALGTLLDKQAWEIGNEVPQDASPAVLDAAATALRKNLAEAERLARRARRHGGFDTRSDAVQLLAEVHTTRAEFLMSPGHDRRAARACRAAARAAAHADPATRVRIGKTWVYWAEATRNASWCAEAYAYLMSVVPLAVAVRYLAEERDKLLADLQSTAEEAGYWLAQVGQITDAALALELGRALSLSEVLGRERPDLLAALRQAGREDLADRYRSALEEYSAAPALDDDGLTSNVHRAWTRYEAVVREIAAVVDIDVPGVPPRFGEITEAAKDGPVVYLAGASRGGYAIIVTTGQPPVYRPLPDLAKAHVAEVVETFLREPDDDIAAMAATVATTIRWLWTAGVGALARDLPSDALVTIVPVGLLTLLPVHAAGGPATPEQEPADWSYLADKVTVRYAHNARTLLRSRDRAASISEEALSLLAVAAPDGDPASPLPYTVREVEQIARRWDRVHVAATAGPVGVTELLTSHNVWHLACHCDSAADRILDSTLLLSGSTVTLRDILTLPPAPRRLAVLSACGTHISGSELPDEAMGLPAGLLQAGFAGVVASHWPVIDRSTALLMMRFHDLWHVQGLPVAEALAQAQSWLRAETHYGDPYFWAPFVLTGY